MTQSTLNMQDFRIAVVCSSNMNRSMEAHAYLSVRGFNVQSYGTGEKVKIPGLTPDNPNCYEFGVTYDEIYKELLAEDKAFYTKNGLLGMLDRNRQVKPCPEKFQASTKRFDVVITCDERVYDQVIGYFHTKESVYNQPVHIINCDVRDNHVEATIGSFIIHDLVYQMINCKDLDVNIDYLLHTFETICHKSFLNCVMFY